MNLETADSAVTVRRLRPQDLEAVIALDARSIGRRRDEYFKLKLKQALSDTGMEVSLAAEVDGVFAGFVLARVYYGEFGMMEPTAVLEPLYAPAMAVRARCRPVSAMIALDPK